MNRAARSPAFRLLCGLGTRLAPQRQAAAFATLWRARKVWTTNGSWPPRVIADSVKLRMRSGLPLPAALLCSVLAMACLNPAMRAAEATNLVMNGDFLQASNDQPSDWQTAGDPAFVTQTARVITDANGKRCVELSCTRFERQTPAAHAMLAQLGQVRLIKGRTYEFSCRLRAEGIAGRSVSVAISDTRAWQNCGLQTAFPLTAAWKDRRHVFKATRDVGPDSRLQIWFCETGTLYVADVRLVECRDEEVEFTDVVEPSPGKNLVPNASFELGSRGWSSLGSGIGWGNLGRLHGRVEAGPAPQGRSFLRIPVGGDQTPVLYFDYYEPLTRRETRPLAANLGWIKVEKGATYTLSCYLRASREGAPAVLGAMAKEPTGAGKRHGQGLALTMAWKRYALTFRPQQRYVFVFVGPDLQQEERVDVDVDALQLERGDAPTEFAPRRPVELALEPTEESGIFFDDQPRALRLRISNDGQAPSRLAVRFRVTDFEDKPAALPDQNLEVPARTTLEQTVPLPGDWRGFYRVSASAEGADTTLATQVRLAIVPRRSAQDSVCGINHAFVTADLIRLASKVGVGWYRDWSLKWQHTEPARGDYHWERADTQIDRVLREGSSVLPLLPPFPSADWSSEAPPTISTRGYPGVRARQAWAPKDPRELAGFVDRAVARYKDRIHLWEFLNEPIYTDYALPAGASRQHGPRTYRPADYVALLKTAAAAMRQADPACQVIGGIAGGPLQMTREIIEAGILQEVDYLNLHIYPGLRAPEAYAGEMTELLKNMQAHGGRKPIWLTEFSYYGADNLPRRPFVPRPDAWAEERLLESERQCADYTLRFFVVMLSHGVQKIFIHSGASGAVNEPNFECALFDYGGTPRKLAPALAFLTRMLGPSPTCVGTKTIGPAGCAAGFETGRQAVLIFWQADEGEALGVTLPSSQELRWLDVMGRKLAGPPAKLSSSLTYLEAPSGRAAALLDRLAP